MMWCTCILLYFLDAISAMLMYLIDMELLFLCFGRARALFLLFVVERFLPANFALCILGWLFMFSIRGFFGSFLFLFSGGGRV